MTKKELKTVEGILFKVYEKGLQQEDCNLTKFANKLNEAINYTRCCTELRNNKKPIDGGTSYATLGRTKGKSDM